MYEHTQRSPLHWLLALLSVFMMAIAWQMRNELAASIVVLLVAVIVLLLSLCFRTLKISDGGDHLHVQFGPIGLFGTKVAYRDITTIEPGRTSWIDGWGIHYVPFRGWTYNLWGFECVKVAQGNRITRIGTDDSGNLMTFLRERLKMQDDRV